jgi:hypothetical protein
MTSNMQPALEAQLSRIEAILAWHPGVPRVKICSHEVPYVDFSPPTALGARLKPYRSGGMSFAFSGITFTIGVAVREMGDLADRRPCH